MLNRIGYFEHRKNNVLTADQHAEGRFTTGPVRHQLLVGLDVLSFRELSVPSIDIAAHYNYTDIDDALEALPPHQVAVWARIALRSAIRRASWPAWGVRYLSAFTDGAAPRTPAVTLFDGMLGYDRGQWRYTVHVQNLTDKAYVSTCLGRGDCWFGQKRTVIASARYRF